MKGELVSALCSCVRDQRRGRTRRFLQGLSSDELQYLADFVGARILEANHRQQCGKLAEDIVKFERCRLAAARDRKQPRRPPVCLQDNDHKMILLFEYLDRCGLESSVDHTAQA